MAGKTIMGKFFYYNWIYIISPVSQNIRCNKCNYRIGGKDQIGNGNHQKELIKRSHRFYWFAQIYFFFFKKICVNLWNLWDLIISASLYNLKKLFDLCGPMIFLFSFYVPRSSMPAFFSAIVASGISCLPASMSSVLQSWWLRMLRLLWSAVKPSFSIAWRSLPSGYSHRNEHRAPGNAPYA